MKNIATPKRQVLRRYPKAYAWHWADGYCIYTGERVNNILGPSGHRSAACAWRHAWNDMLNERRAQTVNGD